MKPSEDRLDRTAIEELQSLLSRHYRVTIDSAHGMSGAHVIAHDRTSLVVEGRSHDLSRAMHRCFLAVEAREQDAGVRK